MTDPEAPVLTTVRGRVGRITLNRPKALNALNDEMVALIDAALTRFENDVTVRVVLIDAVGDRAFCAGGDIRAIYDAMLAGEPAGPLAFWADEYRMNLRVATFRKPVVSLLDGIVMGGGIGLGGHARHRVVTERSQLAMPEVGIGFGPDVGGTWLLSRGTGELGTHVALTGGRVGAADAITVGLADHHVPADRLTEFGTALEMEGFDAVLERFETEPAPGELDAARGWIDSCYAADDVQQIVRNLEESGEVEAKRAAGVILGNSPTAVTVTLRSLRLARSAGTLAACFQTEYRVSRRFLEVPDFREGVRAAVVDKDRTPHWTPATLAEVGAADVDTFFTRRIDDLVLAPTERQS